MRPTVRLIIWLLVPGVVLVWASRSCAQNITQAREAAVLKFRAGQREEAESALRDMLAGGRDDATTVAALPRVLFRPRMERTTWVSPDRGLR